MKHKLIILATICLLLFTCMPWCTPEAAGNVLETDFKKWETYQNTQSGEAVTVSTAENCPEGEGNGSLYIPYRARNGYGAASATVIGGESYILSFWYRSNCTAGLQIVQRSTTHKVTLQQSFGEWKKAELILKTMSNVSSITIRLGHLFSNSQVNSGEYIYYDAPSLLQIDNAFQKLSVYRKMARSSVTSGSTYLTLLGEPVSDERGYVNDPDVYYISGNAASDLMIFSMYERTGKDKTLLDVQMKNVSEKITKLSFSNVKRNCEIRGYVWKKGKMYSVVKPVGFFTQTEYITNGGFEILADNGTLASWQRKGAATHSENSVYEGKYAAVTSGSTDNYVREFVTLPQETAFTLSFRIYKSEDGGTAKYKLEYSTGTSVEKTITGLAKGEWNYVSVPIDTKNGKSFYSLYLRSSGGTFYWDAVSIVSNITEGKPTQNEWMQTDEKYGMPLKKGANGIQNGSFETFQNGYPVHWSDKAGTQLWKSKVKYIKIDDDNAYDGNVSVKISTEDDSTPYIRQDMEVTPNTTYELSLWSRTEMMTRGSERGFRCKFEFCKIEGEEEITLGSAVSDEMTPSQLNCWEQAKTRFVTPEGATFVKILLRQRSSYGTFWIDKVECYPVSEAAILTVETDQCFYYPDTESGVIKATLSSLYAGSYQDGTVDFILRKPDNTEVTLARDISFSDDMAYCTLPIEYLRRNQKEAFYIRAVLKDKSGNSAATAETDIYCYPRPALLGADGVLKNADGTPFICTLGYHVGSGEETAAKAVGVTLSQIGSGNPKNYLSNPAALKKQLDALESAGMKGIVSLYPGMASAAHPENIAMTRAVVEGCKSHPAVYGWAVMDEPFGQIEMTEYWLKEAYKTIRDIDDVHPVFLMLAGNLKEGTKYCDVIGDDPYPHGNQRTDLYPLQSTQKARNAAERYGKPYLILNQAYQESAYKPKNSDLRASWYQAISEGAYGAGWYAYSSGIAKVPAYVSYLGQFKAEQELSESLFGRSSRTVCFNQGEEETYAYQSVLSGRDLYMLVFSRNGEGTASGTQRDTETQVIEVPLYSLNGLVKAEGTPEALFEDPNGTGFASNPVINGDVLELSVIGKSVALIKIPNAVSTQDIEKLQLSSFTDIDACSEAEKSAIEAVYRKGVLDKIGDRSFAPNTVVLCGEFKNALLRSLDMTYRAEEFASYFAGREMASLSTDEMINFSLEVLRQDMRFGGTAADLKAEFTKVLEKKPSSVLTRAEAAVFLSLFLL